MLMSKNGLSYLHFRLTVGVYTVYALNHSRKSKSLIMGFEMIVNNRSLEYQYLFLCRFWLYGVSLLLYHTTFTLIFILHF